MRMLIRLVNTLVCTPLSDSVLGRAGIREMLEKRSTVEFRLLLAGTAQKWY